MSYEWLIGEKTNKNRILKAVNKDEVLAEKIMRAIDKKQVEYVLSRVDRNGNVHTIRLDKNGNEVGVWP